ncbi:hypothetical protein NMY22_g4030 [Coprinellus aureogranulatus]|nr:hypothetical protein NMY22_g4030 [Coprinellus aureogranulatus]
MVAHAKRRAEEEENGKKAEGRSAPKAEVGSAWDARRHQYHAFAILCPRSASRCTLGLLLTCVPIACRRWRLLGSSLRRLGMPGVLKPAKIILGTNIIVEFHKRQVVTWIATEKGLSVFPVVGGQPISMMDLRNSDIDLSTASSTIIPLEVPHPDPSIRYDNLGMDPILVLPYDMGARSADSVLFDLIFDDISSNNGNNLVRTKERLTRGYRFRVTLGPPSSGSRGCRVKIVRTATFRLPLHELGTTVDINMLLLGLALDAAWDLSYGQGHPSVALMLG